MRTKEKQKGNVPILCVPFLILPCVHVRRQELRSNKEANVYVFGHEKDVRAILVMYFINSLAGFFSRTSRTARLLLLRCFAHLDHFDGRCLCNSIFPHPNAKEMYFDPGKAKEECTPKTCNSKVFC